MFAVLAKFTLGDSHTVRTSSTSSVTNVSAAGPAAAEAVAGSAGVGSRSAKENTAHELGGELIELMAQTVAL
jgi:hypothetical protein